MMRAGIRFRTHGLPIPRRHAAHPLAGGPRRLPVLASAAAGAILALALACGGAASDDAAAEAVRDAVRKHVQSSGGEMRFEDPTRDEPVAMRFDHVHEAVHPTEGGRQVVCVDFQGPDGTVYDVDFYVDREGTTEDLLVEDAVLHKVGKKDVLTEARRQQLDQAS